jgi:hypothetical protein
MYEWVGFKDFCNDPHCCVLWVETDQGKTAEIRPGIGQKNYLTFRINVGTGGRFDVHFLFTWAVDNNGAWIDGFSVEKIEEIPPMTWEQELWNFLNANKAIAFNKGSALQVAIKTEPDGRYDTGTNELDFVSKDGKPIKTRWAVNLDTGKWRAYWVYVPEQGQPWGEVHRFDDPAVSPPLDPFSSGL